MSSRPADARYAKSHEWVRIRDGIATVGITDFAVEHLGDLVFVQLPEVGATIEAGESVCEVESVKAVGEVYAPVGGEVTEINEGLVSDQGPLKSSPFEEGWLFRVRTKDDARDLLSLNDYERSLIAS